MDQSICRFMPVKNYNSNLKTINFVYETELHTLRQPFFHHIYRLCIVKCGSGVMKTGNMSFELKEGTLWLNFAGTFSEIEATEDFKFIYISFMGTGVPEMLEAFDITEQNPVYCGYEFLVDFWESSINRITRKNMNVLTESVLLYTVSYIGDERNAEGEGKKQGSAFEKIAAFIDDSFDNSQLSLFCVANAFGYTEKYVSYLFKKNMNVNFKTYLNKLRIQHACDCILEGNRGVSEIAAMCGFSDPLYFSKTFKKHMGCTPTQYMNKSEVRSD